MAPKPEDIRPLYLSHLAIPKDSVGQAWLRLQGEQRKEAVEIVSETAQEWFGSDYAHLPKFFWEAFAERVVAAIDQRL